MLSGDHADMPITRSSSHASILSFAVIRAAVGLLGALENFYHQKVMVLKLERDKLDVDRRIAAARRVADLGQDPIGEFAATVSDSGTSARSKKETESRRNRLSKREFC